jgi:uncharacterized membrane protein (UPF0127 family)
VRTVRVVNLDTGHELAARAGVATSFWARGRGLLGRRALPPGEGLVIEACRQVHMFFMAFPIDVLHVRRLTPEEGEVTRVLEALRPNRLGPWVWRSDYVVELPAGTAARTGTRVGHRIALRPPAGE